MPSTTLIGLDIGQMSDYTALAIVERQTPAAYHPHEQPAQDRRSLAQLREAPPPATYVVRHLQRFELGTSYVQIMNRIASVFRETLPPPVVFLLDTTGVGRGIFDMFRAIKLRPKAITVHGGGKETHQGDEWHIPKTSLVFALTAAVQDRPTRLHLGEKIPFVQEITHEMRTFTSKINPDTAHESFLAWREQDHDDLLFALSLCVWWGEKPIGRAYVVPILT
jgi:hypothetical protein